MLTEILLGVSGFFLLKGYTQRKVGEGIVEFTEKAIAELDKELERIDEADEAKRKPAEVVDLQVYRGGRDERA